MWVEVCCWFSPFLWEVFLRVLRFPPRQNQDIAIVSSFQVRDIAIIWGNQVRDIAIVWRYRARDITIIWRYPVRYIAITWRYPRAGYRYDYLEISSGEYRYCMEDVVNNLVSHGHHEQQNENENITNKQRIKKGQNSSTWLHKQTHKITLVLFIVLWGGSILLLSSYFLRD